MPTDPELAAKAIAVSINAHAPYSQFQVGAALLTADGQVFTGCNVENASYGLTNCAERVAVGSAIAAGQADFTKMAIASPGGHSPCGACRQVLAEFAPDLEILLVDSTGEKPTTRTTLTVLLPGQFRLNG